MAEAGILEDRTAAPARYYCHMCKVEINIPNTDFTCPMCSLGFVEELPANQTPAATANGGPPNAVGAAPSGRGLQTFLMSRNGPNVEISIDGRRRNGRLPTLDNVLLDFLQHITTEFEQPNFGPSGMVYLGNVGDYAWGREGIDSIVTQLLNQMETSGPPPMTKEKIADIPKVEVTSKEVDSKQQCSVCWEDFQLQETVRKLPCTHIYHENCIVPWLNLHGTCPICRKLLIDENTDAVASGSIDNPHQPLTAPTPDLLNAIRNSANRRGAGPDNTELFAAQNQTPNENPGGSSQSQNRPNNVFGFDNDNVDLD